MRKIPISGVLGKGMYALVDEIDFSELQKLTWHLDSKGYAVKWSIGNRKNRYHVYMHRLINQTLKGLETDHIDGNRLNNQRHNLRSLTHIENCRNNHSTNSNSGILGVNWHKASKKWRAYISLNGKPKQLGVFKTKEEAAFTRKMAEKEFWRTVTLS